MALLAIDTSSRICVLGVRVGSDTVVDETDLGRTHSQEILPRIEALLDRAEVAKRDIRCVVYGQGPGSFTGLRIGIGVVQGLAYGLNVPVVGISSLACLAHQYITADDGAALVALAARNTEVYFGAYQKTSTDVQLVGHEGVFEAAEIPAQDPVHAWIGVGDGWCHDASLVSASGVEVKEIIIEPKLRAKDLLDLGELALQRGEAKSAAEALPEYLREQVAERPRQA